MESLGSLVKELLHLTHLILFSRSSLRMRECPSRRVSVSAYICLSSGRSCDGSDSLTDEPFVGFSAQSPV